MKKIIIIILILPLFLFCSFKKKEKPYIILSSGSISLEYVKRIERGFSANQRINYALVAPDGFKTPGIRLQISKQDEKTSNWGFSIIQSRDLYLDLAQNIYRDYIYIQRPGRYILQFFYLNNKDYPFAHKEFLVQ
ncbi:MAG: hypothetical protein LUH11_03035 [Candidatus Gastranaerophilales bacterium]|nr:hypothetical protein [Candidatus Gastranaerophilales bacterium]